MPCIFYDSKVKTNKMATVKLEKKNAGVLRKQQTLVFEARDRVEGFLHVIDLFTKNANQLGMTASEKWTALEDVVDKVAANKWDTQIRGIINAQKILVRLESEQEEFVQRYSGGKHPRDVLLKYLESSHCVKPISVDPEIHASRIEVMCSYTNRLNSTDPDLNKITIKKKIFESFPASWQRMYKMGGRDFEADDIHKIVDFMKLCKGGADKRFPKKNKGNNNGNCSRNYRGNGNNGGRGRGRGNFNRGGRGNRSNVCFHHGGHD